MWLRGSCKQSFQILAVNCEYFDGQFFGEFADRNKDEVILADLDFDDFVQLLKVMYPPYEQVDGTSRVTKRIPRLFLLLGIVILQKTTSLP